ncbi:glycerol-3-phosphate 1-O-acyltransferase PlsY [Haloplasma contractile]|uniref:Glycerol-3-phosphate acyltransferase n=1 Tax=Haloplasma contractile SSD-17B TaxID=1033810 RepID=U2EGK5_9MOLU|nr:glycerol-3-phosphate 1-O-acyltransferase PlsY [Haloplasma contractile]ERJ13746.1 Glycerol-3-phosphate acyltransferase protein [Haloplasma contractile SSD-17B]
MFLQVFYFFIAYLFGSIPSGLIIGKLFRGIDIRKHGSGNLGGTNAIRVLGKKLGSIVGLMDILKGGVVILLVDLLGINTGLSLSLFGLEINSIDPLFYGIFAVIGHVFPIFANFKGGKAVATSAGILLFYQPFVVFIGLIFFVLLAKTTRYVSVASTVGAMFIFITTLFIDQLPHIERERELTFDINTNLPLQIITFLLVLFIVIRHIPNYKRLIKGTESKIGQKKNK